MVITVRQAPVVAEEVKVEISGQVEYNQVQPANSRMGHPKAGDEVTYTFQVDSTNFTDSNIHPTRGYPIIGDSLSAVIGSETFGIQDPLTGNNPLFILRNNDPKVDGFLIGTSVNGFENGAPLNEEGAFGPFRMNFLLTYLHDPLPSLDILDALGTYSFNGISSYHLTIDDGAFNPVGIIFKQMTIKAIPNHEVEIEAFNIKSMSFAFASLDGYYHSVEASPNLEDWMIVGQFSGNGHRVQFEDQRGDLGNTQFFRVKSQKAPMLNSLMEREWFLTAMHVNSEVITPKKNRVHTIQFKPNKSIEGRNDCNTYFGRYSLENGNTLNFGDAIASTKVLCEPGSIDSAFFQALGAAKGFEVTDKNLTIYYGPESQNRLEFRSRN